MYIGNYVQYIRRNASANGAVHVYINEYMYDERVVVLRTCVSACLYVSVCVWLRASVCV